MNMVDFKQIKNLYKRTLKYKETLAIKHMPNKELIVIVYDIKNKYLTAMFKFKEL